MPEVICFVLLTVKYFYWRSFKFWLDINVMREVCLHNNWSCVPENVQGITNIWTPWSFFGWWWWWDPTIGGSHLEWRVEARGEGSLPNSFRGELIFLIKTHFYGGALTSHFMGEHSPTTSEDCLPRVRNIFLFGRKLEYITRLIYFYIFFRMLNTRLCL